MTRLSGAGDKSPRAQEAERPLRLEYLPAAQLSENPANWRLHPPEQMEALDAVMAEVGWAGALLYNNRTGRLLDGHARRQLFASRGGEVPVLVGSWDEAVERKIIALLDSVGDMAETDVEKLAALEAEIRAGAGAAVERLTDMLAPKLAAFQALTVPVVSLQRHPQNYREHPPEQIAHLVRSIEEHGFYRNVVIARDHTVLAGHGVVQAALRMGRTRIPVVRLPLDPDDSRALRLVVADNEVGQLANRDDRRLTELLREIAESGDLLGTGHDRMTLAGLLFTTRTREEIADFDAAAHWVGMPDYDSGSQIARLTIHFMSEEVRTEFVKQFGIVVTRETRGSKSHASAWWPPREAGRDDLVSVRWEEEEIP